VWRIYFPFGVRSAVWGVLDRMARVVGMGEPVKTNTIVIHMTRAVNVLGRVDPI
jgi:hypothetical protein